MTTDHHPPEPGSRIFLSMRLRLHYVDWGNEAKPPLLLLHGGRDHCRSWDWVARDLQRDYHVIAPDLRGHGDSQWSSDGNYSLAPHVYDLAQLIDQLGVAPITIVAHSFGGFVAARYAGIFPEKVAKLVLIEGITYPPQLETLWASQTVEQRWQEWVNSVRSASGRLPRRYASLEAAVTRMREENPRLSEEQARHLTRYGVQRNEDGTFSWKFDNYVRSLSPVDLTEAQRVALMRRITCPTLLIYGTDSWAVPPDAAWMEENLKVGRLASIAGAGHWPHHDDLPTFLGLLRNFLDG